MIWNLTRNLIVKRLNFALSNENAYKIIWFTNILFKGIHSKFTLIQIIQIITHHQYKHKLLNQNAILKDI